MVSTGSILLFWEKSLTISIPLVLFMSPFLSIALFFPLLPLPSYSSLLLPPPSNRVIENNQALFRRANNIHFFTDGGPHHYKCRHGILGFAHVAHSLFLKMTNSVPQMAFHIYAANHGSDICDCVASIDKKAIRKYSLKHEEKQMTGGEDLVEALGDLNGEFFHSVLEVFTFLSLFFFPFPYPSHRNPPRTSE